MAALQPQALLVVTDTTQGMEFGIDAHVWTLGAKFEGLHSIGAGLHLLTAAPATPHGHGLGVGHTLAQALLRFAQLALQPLALARLRLIRGPRVLLAIHTRGLQYVQEPLQRREALTRQT